VAEYQLFLRSSADGATETMQLDGDNIVRTLELAHGDGFRGSAEVWCDGSRLCNIEYSDEHGFWTVIPPAGVAAPVIEPVIGPIDQPAARRARVGEM
jgi:hypothetical protein